MTDLPILGAGDVGEFRITDRMLFDLPRERFHSVNDMVNEVIASNPDYEFVVLEEMPSRDHIIRWSKREVPAHE